jgi:hypothetical protein
MGSNFVFTKHSLDMLKNTCIHSFLWMHVCTLYPISTFNRLSPRNWCLAVDGNIGFHWKIFRLYEKCQSRFWTLVGWGTIVLLNIQPHGSLDQFKKFIHPFYSTTMVVESPDLSSQIWLSWLHILNSYYVIFTIARYKMIYRSTAQCNLNLTYYEFEYIYKTHSVLCCAVATHELFVLV